MLHPDPMVGHQDSHNIKLIHLAIAPVPVDPHPRATHELPPLPVVHRLHRIAKRTPLPRFYFDECNRGIALRDEVNVAVSIAEPTGENAIAVLHQPAFGDALPELPKSLIVCRHGGEARGGHVLDVTAPLPQASKCRVPLARALHGEDRTARARTRHRNL